MSILDKIQKYLIELDVPEPEEYDEVDKTLEVPENFYGVGIVDDEGKHKLIKSFENEKFQVEDESLESIIDYLTQNSLDIAKIVLEEAPRYKNVPLGVIIYREGKADVVDDMIEVTDTLTAEELDKWIKKTIAVDFTKYYDNSDNWKEIDNGSEDYEA